MSLAGGFTLLELLAVLGVLAALSGVALPDAQRRRDSWRLAAAARQVVMDLKLARATAIAGGVTHRLHFPVPGTAYQHERRSPDGYEPVGPATDLPDGISAVACTASGAGFAFRPRGHAATFGTLTLRNRLGEQRRVVVDIAGRTQVR
jgi:prepilin-type N-terminal cleavage/methylation domain-containing protein